MKKTAFAFLLLALGVASAKTYNVTLFQPSMVAGTELAAGDYKLEVEGTKATLKAGKKTTTCNVRIEKAADKSSSTRLRMVAKDGKMHLSEIRLGGTDTKVIVED
jgi:hypothetical protein